MFSLEKLTFLLHLVQEIQGEYFDIGNKRTIRIWECFFEYRRKFYEFPFLPGRFFRDQGTIYAKSSTEIFVFNFVHPPVRLRFPDPRTGDHVSRLRSSEPEHGRCVHGSSAFRGRRALLEPGDDEPVLRHVDRH